MGSLWTTRVSNDGLLCSVGSPARAGVARPDDHLPCMEVSGSAKKRDSSDPESGLLRPIVDRGSLSHYWCPHMWRPESREQVRVAL